MKTESKGFSKEEKAAMRARDKEMKAEAKGLATRAAGEQAIQEAIAAMPDEGRVMAERIHAIVQSNAPQLLPKTWYGMPAYANEDGKVVFFMRGAEKFSERYMTLGFNQEANLDEGDMWPVAFALTRLTSVEEKRIADLIKQAVS